MTFIKKMYDRQSHCLFIDPRICHNQTFDIVTQYLFKSQYIEEDFVKF